MFRTFLLRLCSFTERVPVDILCTTSCWLSSVTVLPSGSRGKRKKKTRVLCQAGLRLPTGMGQMVSSHTHTGTHTLVMSAIFCMYLCFRVFQPVWLYLSHLVVVLHADVQMYHKKNSLWAKTLNDILFWQATVNVTCTRRLSKERQSDGNFTFSILFTWSSSTNTPNQRAPCSLIGILFNWWPWIQI